MSQTERPNTYDQVPYPSYPLPQSHPWHLAALATLLGLEPTAPESCRVLELGCASGGNLIPMAISLPQAQFLGIDMSGDQITAGQRTIAELGLANVELRKLSILDVDETFGEFDYVICHGVFSWVPAPVQDKILAICRDRLVEDGIGYVSYNTHPGWHLRGLVRHMLSFHVSRYPEDSPQSSIERARRLLDFLARAAPERDRAYSALLQEQAELLRLHSDAYLFHEHLEEHNEPCWFLDFCERLQQHDLRYLAEAEFGTMVAGLGFPPDVQAELDELAPHLLEKEQYMDFVRNRSFRQTLVCHARLRPQYDVRATRLEGLSVSSRARPLGESLSLADEATVEFQIVEGLTLETSIPIVKAALTCLGEIFPAARTFGELYREAHERVAEARKNAGNPDVGTAANEERTALARALLTSFARGNQALVRLALGSPPLALAAPDRPLASPLARLQARQNQPVTNLLHEVVPVTPFDRHLLPLLDGHRDCRQLEEELFALHQKGELRISQDDQPVTSVARAREILREILEQQLPQLARAGLLLGSTFEPS